MFNHNTATIPPYLHYGQAVTMVIHNTATMPCADKNYYAEQPCGVRDLVVHTRNCHFFPHYC